MAIDYGIIEIQRSVIESRKMHSSGHLPAVVTGEHAGAGINFKGSARVQITGLLMYNLNYISMAIQILHLLASELHAWGQTSYALDEKPIQALVAIFTHMALFSEIYRERISDLCCIHLLQTLQKAT